MIFSKRTTILTLLLALLGSMRTVSAQQESHQEMMSTFLDIVEKEAYKSPSINWDSIRPIALAQADTIQSQEDLRALFKKILRQLKDSHSSILYTEDASDTDDNEVLRQYATVTYEQAGYTFPDISGRMIENRYAYVNVPGVVLEHKKYIQLMGEQISILDQQNPKAWIFDVSDNDGGSIWPMLWHLYNFIDQENIYSFVDRNGHEQFTTRAMWDENNLDEEELLFFDLAGLSDSTLKPIEIKNNELPIFVITSEKTASSGEFFVAALKGQKNVRVIGQTTNGLTSANEVFPINKQYVINLMTSVIKDREGKVYAIGEGITPDVVLPLSYDATPDHIKKSDVRDNRIKIALQHIQKMHP